MVFPGKLMVILLAFCCTSGISFGQLRIEEELTGIFDQKDSVRKDYAAPIKESNNDISTIVSVGFLFYKSFISSQDNPSCVFTPSCSEYAVQAIHQKGFLVGWLMTFDRLSRCHGLVGHHHYPIDIEHKRYYDPVL